MTFAFEISMLERAGAGEDLAVQANTIAEASVTAVRLRIAELGSESNFIVRVHRGAKRCAVPGVDLRCNAFVG
jgi:hypothetical protein